MRFPAVLDQLEIGPGDLVFLHTSFRRITALVDGPEDLVTQLLRRLGPRGTLAMPRYAWHLDPAARPWKGYREYLERRPSMDLRNTPANIGVVPDAFRTRADALASISNLWPVCAVGPAAAAITESQEKVEHPYGPGSTFHRLLEMEAKVVGLGVTLNTTSLAPVTDCLLGPDWQQRVFTQEPVPGTVIDLAGREHRVQAYTLLPETVRDIRPSAVLTGALVPGTDFPYQVRDGTIFFAYQAGLYHRAATRMAAAAQGGCPWLAG